MPISIVVGGQFGSEGKGKVACALAGDRKAAVAVRVGGSNSGHTVVDSQGNSIAFRQLPTASILSDTICVIGAGSYIDADVLLKEIQKTALAPDRLLIDRNSTLITDRHRKIERDLRLREKIGSTGSGTGAAVIDRIARSEPPMFAPSDTRLSPYIGCANSFMRDQLNRRKRIVIEGTQGFGLSLLHSDHYPHVTSRDTTAAGFLTEAGLSPIDVDEVVMVLRAFPIRVAGLQSGPLPHETDWETVTEESASPNAIDEKTTVTGNIRRVARFDAKVVRSAIIPKPANSDSLGIHRVRIL